MPFKSAVPLLCLSTLQIALSCAHRLHGNLPSHLIFLMRQRLHAFLTRVCFSAAGHGGDGGCELCCAWVGKDLCRGGMRNILLCYGQSASMSIETAKRYRSIAGLLVAARSFYLARHSVRAALQNRLSALTSPVLTRNNHSQS